MEKYKDKNERYAERFFKAHGFEYRLVKQWISKTIWELSKDGETYKWELPNTVTNIKKYMELALLDYHELRLRTRDLKAELEGENNGKIN